MRSRAVGRAAEVGIFPGSLPGSAEKCGARPANERVRLQFPNTDVREVLEFYERLTGKHLVTDNQVQGTVNISVAGELPAEEAVRIIEINLLLNGITMIPVEHSNIVKVVGTGKNPRG